MSKLARKLQRTIDSETMTTHEINCHIDYAITERDERLAVYLRNTDYPRYRSFEKKLINFRKQEEVV